MLSEENVVKKRVDYISSRRSEDSGGKKYSPCQVPSTNRGLSRLIGIGGIEQRPVITATIIFELNKFTLGYIVFSNSEHRAVSTRDVFVRKCSCTFSARQLTDLTVDREIQ